MLFGNLREIGNIQDLLKMTLKNNQKKDWGKLLFTRDNLSQKEIAQKVGVSEATVCRWAKDDKWDLQKASLTITREEALTRIYCQINEINAAIMKKDEGQRFAIGKEADALSKLAAAARSMETDASVTETMEVFKRFLNWLRGVDINKAKEFVEYQDNYIKTILK